MPSGGIYSPFLEDKGLTPGSDQPLRWVVKDDDGVNVASFSGWTGTMYLLVAGGRSRHDGPTALAAAGVDLLHAFTLTLTTAPNADVTIAAADWATYGITAGTYDYETWRTDSGNVRRLAYGPFVVIS